MGGAVQPRDHDRIPSAPEYTPRAGHLVRHVVVQAPLYCLRPHSDVRSIGGLLRGCAEEFVSGETEYAVICWRDYGGIESMCEFEMRDVWMAERADEYWEVDVNHQPRYDMAPWD